MRPRASTALVVKVSGVRANPESFKRYRDSGSSARAFRAGEDAPRELCRLTASSNDIALLEKERENEREREREKETGRTRPRQRERARSGNEGGFRRMQPLSIDNPRPHQRRYAITTTAFSSSTTTTTIITTTTVGTSTISSYYRQQYRRRWRQQRRRRPSSLGFSLNQFK